MTGVEGFDSDFAGPADYAHLYRAAGLQVVPAHAPGEVPEWKRPLGNWRQHQKALLDDPSFDAWYGETGAYRSRANLGMLTGDCSGGVWVLDIDSHSKPEAAGWWQGQLAVHNNGMEPETPAQVTGGGGRQLLWRSPAGWAPPTGKTSIGIDVRGTGGFAMLPPSVHASGRTYAWQEGRSPAECDILEAPQWLCEVVDKLLDTPAPLDLPVQGKTNGAAHPRAATPSTATTPIAALHIDRREEYMRDLVWAAVVGLYRDSPIRPSKAVEEEEAEAAYRRYLLRTETRLQGPPEALEALLEEEGRGLSLFRDKWRRAMGQWGVEVAAAAGVAKVERRTVPLTAPPEGGKGGKGGDPDTGEIAFGFTPFEWIDPATLPARDKLYGGYYNRKFLSAVISPGGIGKSSLVMVEAMAMVSGKNLLGITPKKRLRVVYWNGEDPLEELQRRAMAIALYYGLEASDLEGLYIDSGRTMPIVIAQETPAGPKIARPAVEGVVAALLAIKADALIVDPFVSIHRVSENDNNAIELVAKQFSAIADMTATAIMLVHHSRKTNGQEVTIEDSRGASALLAATRSGRALNRMTDKEGADLGVENHRLYFRSDDGKTTLSPPPEGASWYLMIGVALGNGAMGMGGDEIGVATRWEPPATVLDPMAGLTSDDLKTVQNAIAAGRWRKDRQATDWAGHVVVSALGWVDDAAARKRATKCLAIWLSTGALVVVEGTDKSRRAREYIEVGNWVSA